MKMMNRKPIRKLWTAILLALVLMLAIPLTVFAYPQITDASLTFDGVTVPDDTNFLVVSPGATISTSVQVTGTGGSYWDDWKSTSWKISTSDSTGVWTCVDTPDHTDAVAHTENFDITAPSTPGIYNVYFRTYTSNGCYLPNQFSDYDEGSMPNSIVVLGNPDILESYGAGCTMQQDDFGGGQGVCMKATGLDNKHWRILWTDPDLSAIRSIDATIEGEYSDSWTPTTCKDGTWIVELQEVLYNPATHTTVYNTVDLDTFNLTCGPAIASYQAVCATADDDFDFGDTVCMKGTALGTNPFYLWRIQWWAPGASLATRTKQAPALTTNSYSDSWAPSPCVAGTWTVSLDRYKLLDPISGWSTEDTDTFNLTCDACTAPSITTQPVNQTITSGDNASFTVAGTNYTSVQWQVNPGTGWSDISGATSETYTLTKPAVSLSGNQYRAVLTGDCAPSAISSAATLTVNADPFIGFSGLTSSLNPSVDGDTVTFTAVTTTSGGAPAGKVIFFEFIIEGYNTTQILLGEDTTAASLGGDSYAFTFSISTLAIGDHAIFAGYENGNGMSTEFAGPLNQTVVEQIWPTVTITSAPPVASYSKQATFAFSSDTEGTAFECSLSEGNVSNFDSLTWSACSSPQTYTDLSYGSNYTFAVKVQGAPFTATTLAWHLWYIAVPQVTITGGPAEFTESTDATITFSSDPAGADLVCYLVKQEYGTQDALILEDWVPCTSPRTLTGLSRGYAYFFGVKPEGTADAYAAMRQWMITRITLTASPNPSESGNAVTFTATLWDDSGTEPGGIVSFAEMVYTWPGGVTSQFLDQGSDPTASGTGSFIYTFSTSELAIGSHDIVALYTVTDEEGTIKTITSLPITQEVTEVTAQAPMITTQPEDYTACAGSSVSFAAAASGTPAPTVQWQMSNDGGTTWNNISGATTATYTISAAASDNGKRYRAVFTNSAGSATSSAAILTVNTAPAVTTQPANQTVTYGVPSATFSAAASGTAPSVKWRSSTNGTTWELVSGATTSNLTIANPTVLMSGTQFRAEFTNVCGTTTSSAATLTVNKAPVTATAGNYNGTYNGAAHSPSGCVVTGAYTGDLSCTNNPSSVGPNVGSGIISPFVSGTGLTNYAITSVSGNWSIAPAEPTCSISGYTGVYDGDPHGASGTCIGVGGTDLSADLDLGATYIDVPGGTANWTFTDSSGNYTNDSGSVNIEITKADPTCSISGYTGVYDGDPHGASGSCTGVKGETLTTLDLGATFTNVAGGTANWSFSDTSGNYTNDSGNVDIVINKANPDCSSISGYTVVYDGDPHGASGTCIGVGGTDLSADLDLGATYIDVPGGTANWTFTDSSGNYNNDSGSVDIVISKADPDCSSINGYTVVYDGDPHGASGSCTGVKGETLTTLDFGATFTNVAGGTANWSFSDSSGNYNNDSGSVEIVITKATPTCSISGYTGVYDGDPHGVSGACTGVKGETLAGLTLGDSFTNVPGGTLYWTFTDETGNYNNDSGSVEIVINKATLTITADNQKAQYSDATPLLTFQYAGFVKDEDSSVIDTEPHCETTRLISSPAGEYPITCSGGDDNNYNFDDHNGTFTVTKEDATITLDNEVAFLVDDPGEDIDELVLYADVQDTYPDTGYEPAPGEIDNALVSMTLSPLGLGTPETATCVKDHDNGSTGYAKVNTFACTFTTVEVNAYLIEANVVGDFYTSVPAEDVLVVYDPSLGFTTAGGWFYWPGTTDKTNFGYTMKYNKKGNKMQGSLLLIRHTDVGNYRIKSNALDGLALGEFEDAGQYVGWASFSGKCTYQEPDWLEPEGNHVFLVYVQDWGEPGAGLDSIWFDVDGDQGNLSMEAPVEGNLEVLDGGNIVVPHTPN